jgi:hypothetical protein
VARTLPSAGSAGSGPILVTLPLPGPPDHPASAPTG